MIMRSLPKKSWTTTLLLFVTLGSCAGAFSLFASTYSESKFLNSSFCHNLKCDALPVYTLGDKYSHESQMFRIFTYDLRSDLVSGAQLLLRVNSGGRVDTAKLSFYLSARDEKSAVLLMTDAWSALVGVAKNSTLQCLGDLKNPHRASLKILDPYMGTCSVKNTVSDGKRIELVVQRGP